MVLPEGGDFLNLDFNRDMSKETKAVEGERAGGGTMTRTRAMAPGGLPLPGRALPRQALSNQALSRRPRPRLGLTGLGLALALALGLAACAKAPAPAVPAAPPPPPAEIRDLLDLPQDPAAYLDPRTEERPFLDPAQSAQATRRFQEHFFSPWGRTRPAYSLQEVARPFRSFAQKAIFGENTLPRPPAWVAALESEAALDTYPSLARRAVTLRRTDLRQMPTDRPVFYDFAKAGEGFPFDYLQNSAVWGGTPCSVTHATRDRSWYLCETPFALGWVRAQDLAFTDSRFEASYRTALPGRGGGRGRGPGRRGRGLPLPLGHRGRASPGGQRREQPGPARSGLGRKRQRPAQTGRAPPGPGHAPAALPPPRATWPCWPGA